MIRNPQQIQNDADRDVGGRARSGADTAGVA